MTVSDELDSGVDTVEVFIGNSPPVVDNANFSIDENSVAGTAVGVVTASDPDGQDVTFAITAGNGGGEFAIDPATGELTVAGALDHEAQDQYVLTVEATDDGSPAAAGSGTITIDVGDVNEAPTVDDANFGISEGAAVGDLVGTVSASDPDDGDSLTFEIIGGNTGTAFAIDNAGVITVAAALDASVQDSYVLTVQVTDTGSLTDTATVIIDVTSSGEAVVITSLTVDPIDPIELIPNLGADATATLVWTGDAVSIDLAWGDNTTTTHTPASGDTSLVATHNYTDTGVFAVTATVTDIFGDEHVIVYEYVVVFDPTAGYVTGNGKFDSLAGNWTPDPTIEGEVKIGFHAKFKKGVLEGEVKIDIKDADEKFRSDELEVFVVAGNYAFVSGFGRFKGDDTDTIYDFVVTLIDGEYDDGDGPDLVRAIIRLQSDPSVVLYDSQAGESDGANPTTVVTHGDLKIKVKKAPQ